jgi:hypothetical protein
MTLNSRFTVGSESSPKDSKSFTNRGSSVSIVMIRGLTVGVWSPAEAKAFTPTLCVQTGSGAHPASYTVGTGGSFPGGKARPERDADQSLVSTAGLKEERQLHQLSPPSTTMALRYWELCAAIETRHQGLQIKKAPFRSLYCERTSSEGVSACTSRWCWRGSHDC